MIGIGKWGFDLKTPFFTGKLYLTVSYKDGAYDFKPELVGYNGPLEYEVLSCKEEGNTLSGELTTNMVPGKRPIKLAMNFNGDECLAFAKVPLLGKVKVRGKKED